MNNNKQVYTTIITNQLSLKKLNEINWKPTYYQHKDTNNNIFCFSILIGNREIIRFTVQNPEHKPFDWATKAKILHSFDCIIDFSKYIQRIINKGWQYIDYKNYGYYLLKEQQAKNPQWQNIYKQFIFKGKTKYDEIFKKYKLKVSFVNNFENYFPQLSVFIPSNKKQYAIFNM